VSDPDAVYWRRPAPERPFPRFDVSGVEEMPRVDIVYTYAGADGAAIDALVEAGTRGIVVASVGRGGTSPGQREALDRAQEAGVFVVVSSRTGAGRVPVRGDLEDWEPGTGLRLGAGDLIPQKARILLMLALTRSSDAGEIVEVFNEM
jgi:L-asparaginase